jgi:hypothetical protein
MEKSPENSFSNKEDFVGEDDARQRWLNESQQCIRRHTRQKQLESEAFIIGLEKSGVLPKKLSPYTEFVFGENRQVLCKLEMRPEGKSDQFSVTAYRKGIIDALDVFNPSDASQREKFVNSISGLSNEERKQVLTGIMELAARVPKSTGKMAATNYSNADPQSKLIPLRSVCLSDVKAQQVNWVWKPFLLYGGFNLIDGAEGLGKTFVTLAIATAVASGEGCAVIGLLPSEPINVLLVSSAENALAFVIKPRLMAMNAPMDKFFAIDEAFTLDEDGFLRLEMKIAETNARLIIIDPLFSFTGKTNIYTDNEIKQITDRLNKIAEKYDCAIWGVRHINKSKGFGDARTAGMGGIGWNSGSRSTSLVGKAPDSGELAVCHYKTNVGELSQKSFGFKIEKTLVTLENGEEIETGKFFWTGESKLTAKRMLATGGSNETSAEESEAVAFLREALRDGKREAKEVEKEAERFGITPKQLRTARQKLGISFGNGICREGIGKNQKTFWSLPAVNAPENSTNALLLKDGHLQGNDYQNSSYNTDLTTNAQIIENGHLRENENTERAFVSNQLFETELRTDTDNSSDFVQEKCWQPNCRTLLHGATICPNCNTNQDAIPF